MRYSFPINTTEKGLSITKNSKGANRYGTDHALKIHAKRLLLSLLFLVLSPEISIPNSKDHPKISSVLASYPSRSWSLLFFPSAPAAKTKGWTSNPANSSGMPAVADSGLKRKLFIAARSVGRGRSCHGPSFGIFSTTPLNWPTSSGHGTPPTFGMACRSSLSMVPSTTCPQPRRTERSLIPKVAWTMRAKGTIHSVWSRPPTMFSDAFPWQERWSAFNGSERDEALRLLPYIRPGAVLLFDRGYPSYHLICSLRDNYNGYFIFRCPAKCTFPAVEEFVRSGHQQGYILLDPSNSYLEGLSRRQRKKAKVIQLRIIRLLSPDGTVSVLLTNLLNQSRFSWEIETNYRNEKVVLEIEEFHGKSANSIRQELYAVAIMSVIARTLMVEASRMHKSSTAEFQFKNAIMTLAAEAAVLATDEPDKAVRIFSEILAAISRVKYYRPKRPRASQPRVTKRPPNKWCAGRRKKLERA
jgi:hypothetical protein